MWSFMTTALLAAAIYSVEKKKAAFSAKPLFIHY